MKTVEAPEIMQEIIAKEKAQGKTVALVPTMGYLHKGHISLLKEGRKQGDILVLSVFVNPTQFGANEDLDKYPRDINSDLKIAEENGVDYVFTPKAELMYPKGFQTYIEVEELSRPMCGKSRPTHFRGVATVVCKLFNIVMPDVALFGRKDYQQLAVIKQMVSDLNITVRILGMPIVRENDGLAMSSRNVYLSKEERRSSLSLIEAINTAKKMFAEGEAKVSELREKVVATINSYPFTSIEYIDFRDSESLKEQEQAKENTLLALAVKIGETRLIDNSLLGEG